MKSLSVTSIQVGKARPMEINGRQVLSAISKTPVMGRIEVGKLGLAGDEQADLSLHGGLSKAIYAFPSEHYSYWREQLALVDATAALPYGGLGENLTLLGLLETDVYVGDELHFSDCILRVTEPRQPCFKFNAVMQDKLAAKKMARTGYSGFYLAVKQSGSIEAGDDFELLPGSRGTALTDLFKVSRLKTRND